MGDIHGCLNEMIALDRMIENDLAQNPVEQHQIIYLGDYVDRGPASRDCLTRLIEKQHAGAICLKGNHDERMTAFLDDPKTHISSFLTYGGVELALSYGVAPVSVDSCEDKLDRKSVV